MSISRPVPASAGAIRYAVVLDAFRQQSRSPAALRGMVILVSVSVMQSRAVYQDPSQWLMRDTVAMISRKISFPRLSEFWPSDQSNILLKAFFANGNIHFQCFLLSHLIGRSDRITAHPGMAFLIPSMVPTKPRHCFIRSLLAACLFSETFFFLCRCGTRTSTGEIRRCIILLF